MKTIALVTGRGNNSLKDKNILDVIGHPVMYYPTHAAKQSKAIDDWYCSSDDEEILKIAHEEGYKRIVRPKELALPTAQHIDCIMHALKVMKEQNNIPDILVVVLANNVTIASKWITECVEIMKKDAEVTAVVPIYKDNDHHPLRAKIINDDGTLQMYEKGHVGKISTNRQDLSPCYFLSHNFWVLKVSNLLSGQEGQQPWGFMGNKIMPYIIDESIDIHQKIDLLVAKNWIEKNYCD
ncbi:MAG: CMP-N-acetylneuraminic acid synthetase [Oscillospiraceae bacterium]